jgi:UDP-glucose 4-epimerase
MKILVTGGAGFIGTALIKKLLKEKHQVTSLDDYSIGTVDNHIKGCNYVSGDVNDINIHFEGDVKFDLIYHLAALSRIQPSFDSPNRTFVANTIGTQKVLEWARYKNAKVVYAGSSSKWHDPYQSPYAACKHIGEEVCKMYKKTYGMNIEIARFYNVYGPGEIIDGNWAAVIGKWRQQIRDGELITIVGDGEQKRDFTHIDDIIDGLWKIGVKDIKHKYSWELGTGLNYSINDVYLMFKERFGCGYINVPNQSGNYKTTLRENDDSLNKLGWKPSDKLRDYILSLNK